MAGKVGRNSDGKAYRIDGKVYRSTDATPCCCDNPCEDVPCGDCASPPPTFSAVVSGVTACTDYDDPNGSYTLTRVSNCDCTWCFVGPFGDRVISINLICCTFGGNWTIEVAICDEGNCETGTYLNCDTGGYVHGFLHKSSFGCSGGVFNNTNIDVGDCGQGYGGTVTIA